MRNALNAPTVATEEEWDSRGKNIVHFSPWPLALCSAFAERLNDLFESRQGWIGRLVSAQMERAIPRMLVLLKVGKGG